MIYKHFNKVISACVLIATSFAFDGCRQIPTVNTATQPPETAPPVPVVVKPPVAVIIGDSELTAENWLSTTDRFVINDSTDLTALTKEIIFQQLVFKEAVAQGYDRDSVMLNELETYKKIIYDNYQEDSSLINELADEAYQHLQQEVEVAHILFYASAFDSPEKILAKKQQAETVLARITNGEAFEELAKQFSDDRTTANANGYMGWYTGLQLLYPLERATFALDIGEVSQPIQTKYGYHLVKLLNKRPSRGRVKVRHLLRVVPENDTVVRESQRVKLDSIRVLAHTGTPFETLVNLYSDDYRTRENGGVLPEFWIGSREEKVVEDAVFELKVNEISAPVLSSAGWHLFQLTEKNPLPQWQQLRPEILAKVTTDSRGEYLESNWITETKKALKFTINQEILTGAISFGNPSLLNGTWKQPTTNQLAATLFSINGESITLKQFLSYVETFQDNGNLPQNFTPEMAMRYFYERFETATLKSYAQRNLELVNPSFRVALQNYFESLVTKNFLNENIYSKSLRDSVGLQNHYIRTIQDYQFPERAQIIEVASKNTKAIELIENQLQIGKPYNLNRGIAPTYFIKNMVNIEPDEQDKLRKLVVFLRRNPQYVVEIGGHTDVNEENHIATERIKTITNFLLENGLPLTQIKENDFGSTQVADRFDWQKNQRVSYRFFSNAITDLERILKNQGFDITIDTGVLTKESILSNSNIPWATGNYTDSLADGTVRKILIEEIYPARTKTFREARASVINGYQQELETKLYNDLLKKYPVEINQNILKDIYRRKISLNQ